MLIALFGEGDFRAALPTGLYINGQNLIFNPCGVAVCVQDLSEKQLPNTTSTNYRWLKNVPGDLHFLRTTLINVLETDLQLMLYSRILLWGSYKDHSWSPFTDTKIGNDLPRLWPWGTPPKPANPFIPSSIPPPPILKNTFGWPPPIPKIPLKGSSDPKNCVNIRIGSPWNWKHMASPLLERAVLQHAHCKCWTNLVMEPSRTTDIWSAILKTIFTILVVNFLLLGIR